MTHIRIPTPAEPRCDFCSGTAIKWDYPARDFSHDTPPVRGVRLTLNSGGDWAACQACHDLIEANDRDRLAEHAAKGFGPSAIPWDALVVLMRGVHDSFWANREGPPHPAPEATT